MIRDIVYFKVLIGQDSDLVFKKTWRWPEKYIPTPVPTERTQFFERHFEMYTINLRLESGFKKKRLCSKIWVFDIVIASIP